MTRSFANSHNAKVDTEIRHLKTIISKECRSMIDVTFLLYTCMLYFFVL